MKIDGNYLFVDSIECQNCFDHFKNKQFKITHREFIRIGLWRTFHENGQLESKGVYEGIHKMQYTDCEFPALKKDPGIFCAGGSSTEYLKDGEWEYYSLKGDLIKVEFYFNGFLADVKTYTD